MKNYRVICRSTLLLLGDAVKDMMEQGWECQGGVSFFYYPPEINISRADYPSNQIWHTQAMVKPNDPVHLGPG